MTEEGRVTVNLLEQILDKLEKKEEVDETLFQSARRIFGGANRESPCPCGSGRQFKDCCKMSWMLVQRRAHQRANETEERSLPSPSGMRNAPGGDAIKWVCQIGRTREGGYMVRSLGAGIQLEPLQVAAEILGAYHALTVEGTLSIAREMIQQAGIENRGPMIVKG